MAEKSARELNAVVGLLVSLTWIFVLLRVYVKAFISKCWGSDDFLLIVSLIFFTTWMGSAFIGVKYGVGRHLADIPVEDVPTALYCWWLGEVFYTITTTFTRLSIALFLFRIAVSPLHRGIIYGTVGGIIAFSTSYFFLVVFQCRPVSFFWGQYAGDKGACINPGVVPKAAIAYSVISFTTDLILVLLPIFLIYHLQMNFRTKVSVAGLLSLGLLAGLAAMIRVPYIRVLALTDDFLYATTDVAIWSVVEPGLGIIAVGAATLRPLFRSFYALTTRKLSNPLAASKLSKPTNSQTPAAGLSGAGQELGSAGRSQHWYKSSVDGGGDGEEVQLRADVGATGKRSAGIVITSSPFTDEHEMHNRQGGARGESRWVRVQVHRTVEVSRAAGESVSSLGSEPETPWPRRETGRSDKDMV